MYCKYIYLVISFDFLSLFFCEISLKFRKFLGIKVLFFSRGFSVQILGWVAYQNVVVTNMVSVQLWNLEQLEWSLLMKI